MAELTQEALAEHTKCAGGTDALTAVSTAASAVSSAGKKIDEFRFDDGQQYSFRAMLARKQASDAASSQKASSVVGSEDLGDLVCRTCGAPKVKGCAYCVRHKKAYQNLMNASMKKDKKTGEFVNATAAEHFEAVFGKGRAPPPDVAIANQVIIEQAALNDASGGGKTSQKQNKMSTWRATSTQRAESKLNQRYHRTPNGSWKFSSRRWKIFEVGLRRKRPKCTSVWRRSRGAKRIMVDGVVRLESRSHRISLAATRGKSR